MPGPALHAAPSSAADRCHCGSEFVVDSNGKTATCSGCGAVRFPVVIPSECLIDELVDRRIFAGAQHVVLVTQDRSGWRLWCARCDLRGERLYQDADQAGRFAGALNAKTCGDQCLPRRTFK